MPKKTASKKPLHHTYKVLFSCIILFVLLLGALIAWVFFETQQVANRQKVLQPFYDTTGIARGKPGKLIRQEAMDIAVPYGKAYRILYHSELGNGTPTISSGMVFIPNTKAPGRGRPIVSWAHGTIGMGESCAPSRQVNPLPPIGGLSKLLQQGFLVTATDYSGLGTTGTEHYLIGEDEARDVLNAVLAAQQVKEAQASNRFALWGHSQGGHAVLFAAQNAARYIPQLELVAVAAAAPAAQLSSLMQQEYAGAVPWVIGPEIAISWPQTYKDLPLQGVLSNAALTNYKRLAFECSNASGIEAMVRNKLAEQFFQIDPNQNATWKKAMQEQTPKPVLKAPLLIIQSVTDTIVLPNTTALFVKKSCEKGSNLTVSWLSNVSHLQTAKVSGPMVATWLSKRFEGIPTSSTCKEALPLLLQVSKIFIDTPLLYVRQRQ